MTFLLDTHVLIWWLENNNRLGYSARNIIENEHILVSAGAVWEIVIKEHIGKLHLPGNIGYALVSNQFDFMPIDLPHTLKVSSLPPIHRDPFDRIQIAQSIVEEVPLITLDKHIVQYPECVCINPEE